jgi:putative oxidoreductase
MGQNGVAFGCLFHVSYHIMSWLFRTSDSWSPLALRFALGIVMFPHGAQKLLGWFGGHGLIATMQHMTSQSGLSPVVALLVILGESLGSVALIAGFLTRFVALSIAIIMVGAVYMVHWSHGFFMNWFGQKAGEGFEYHLLALGICFALVLMGAGKWSIDRKIVSK